MPGRPLAAWKKENGIKHLQLSDFRRQMLPAYGALVTDEASPIFRYPKRAYFIIDKKRRREVRQGAREPDDAARALRGPGGAQGVQLLAAVSRGGTALPGRPERWGVWGAISGPPTF